MAAIRVIEDSLVIRLAGDPRFVEEFPFLKKVLAQGQKCGTCPGKNRRLAHERREQVNAAKADSRLSHRPQSPIQAAVEGGESPNSLPRKWR